MEDGKPSKKLHVCVCGGGNGAHCAAGYIASKGYTVNVRFTLSISSKFLNHREPSHTNFNVRV